LGFVGEPLSGELADEEEEDAGVGDLDTDFSGRELEATDVRREQIDYEERADKIAAGEDERNFPAEQIKAQDNPLIEIMRLDIVKALIHLRECADKDQHNSEGQQDDREPERREKFNQPAKGHRGILPVV
jgi:hypothetical protein